MVCIQSNSSRGKIVRIKIKNFMTYDDAELVPGPNLNMILGPNGTGKSAFVCCIIVGLAGEVNLTGRGGSPADFVKKGRDASTTEIELHNDRGDNYIVTRKITILGRSQHKIDHKSEWKINQSPCNKSDVTDLTKELNIKVDNLCQFLPQDSVTQFVKMSPCELLLNTLKAAGDNQLVDDHNKLVNCTKDVSEKRQALEDLRSAFKENEVNAKRLESEVHQLREREAFMKQKTICSHKILYAKYIAAKSTHDENVRERDAIRQELSEVESRSEPYKRAVDLQKGDMETLTRNISSSNSQIRESQNLIQTQQNMIENRKVDCQQEFSKFKTKMAEESERESKIVLKQQELDSLEGRLNSTRDVDYSGQIVALDKDIASKKQELLICSREKSNIEDELRGKTSEIDNARQEIEQITSVRQKKINLLKARFPEVYKVLDWLLMNKSKFKKQIFCPMMVEINVKKLNYSKLVENSINQNELKSFVCMSEQDLMTFTRAVRDELKLRVNVILAPTKTLEEFKEESHSNPDLRPVKVGHKYLIELVDAPEPILRYLCGNNNFHRIPALLDDCSDADLKYMMSNFSRFYIRDNFFSVGRSRNDGQSITVNDTVRDAHFLVYSLDESRLTSMKKRLDELENLKKDMMQRREEIMKREDELKREWQSLIEQRQNFKVKQEERTRLELMIKRTREALAKLEEVKIDLNAERRKLQQSVDQINRSIIVSLTKLVDASGKHVELKRLQMVNILLLKNAERCYRSAQKKYNESREDTSRLQKDLQVKQTSINQARGQMNAAKTVAEENIPGFADGKLDQKTQSEFDSIPEETVEDLIAKKDELKLRIQRIYNDRGNTIMTQYKKQTEEMKDKQIRIAELEASIGQTDDNLSTIKRTWLPRVEEVIKVIDKNYTDFMQKLRYDGRVKLDFDPQKPNNFDLYGIKIYVKYRDNEALEPLSSTRQSGGERSVATMIYMLALQTKTTVPFRCVDEINQGMDKENERKVFELLVKTADSSSSQYFLISPKLLPNLPYSKKMRIHIVFNGEKQALRWNK